MFSYPTDFCKSHKLVNRKPTELEQSQTPHNNTNWATSLTHRSQCRRVTRLAIYQLLLGWKTLEILLWNRRFSSTQGQPKPRKIRWKVAFGPLFFSPTATILLLGLGLVLYRKQTTKNPTRPNSPRTPYTWFYCNQSVPLCNYYRSGREYKDSL